MHYTKTGKAMRAVSFNVDAAKLMGINTDRNIALTFALGSALAAAGGILVSLNYPKIDPLIGVMTGLKAFVAAVLGGIGNIAGAMLGGAPSQDTANLIRREFENAKALLEQAIAGVHISVQDRRDGIVLFSGVTDANGICKGTIPDRGLAMGEAGLCRCTRVVP